jgi:hypothetical protein
VSRFLRSKLSFANVVACLALFVALGGSSYAALRVDSSMIANNSVTSKDLKNNGVRGRDIRKGTVRGTDVRDGDLQGRDVRNDTLSGSDVRESSLAAVPSALNAQALGGKPASGFLTSDELQRVGPLRLAHGESQTVAAIGPFTWKASCSDAGASGTNLTVTAESTEADSYTTSFGGPGGGSFGPGSPLEVINADSTTPGYQIAFPLSAAAPSGAAPVGIAFIGIKVGGADCLVNGWLQP